MNASSPIDPAAAVRRPLYQRAPLFPALCVLIAAIAVAGSMRVAEPGRLLIGGLALLGLAGLCHLRALRSGWLRPVALTAGLFALALAWTQVQLPGPLVGWGQLPPREAELSVTVRQLFAHSAGQRGLAEVGPTGEPLGDLSGHWISFSLRTPREGDPTPLELGASYRLRGVLEGLPDSGNSFEGYLQRRGVHLQLRRAERLEQVRAPPGWRSWSERQQAGARALIAPGPEARGRSVLAAMLLGQRELLEAPLVEAFARGGVLHLFAVSGLHVLFVAGAARAVASPLRRLHTLLPVFAMLAASAAYVGLVGAPPSALRAWSMLALLTLALSLRRQVSLFALLVASALGTLLFEPRVLWDLGFQLSYAVVAALILMAQPLQRHIEHLGSNALFRPVWELGPVQRLARVPLRYTLGSLLVSLAAFLGGATLAAQAFGRIAPGGILLNLPLVPMATLAVGGGALALALNALGWTLPAQRLVEACAQVTDAMSALTIRATARGIDAPPVEPIGTLWAYGTLACGLGVLWLSRPLHGPLYRWPRRVLGVLYLAAWAWAFWPGRSPLA